MVAILLYFIPYAVQRPYPITPSQQTMEIHPTAFAPAGYGPGDSHLEYWGTYLISKNKAFMFRSYQMY